MINKDFFLNDASLSKFIMPTTWLLSFLLHLFCGYYSFLGYGGVGVRSHSLGWQDGGTTYHLKVRGGCGSVVLEEAKLPTFFGLGYVSILFFQNGLVFFWLWELINVLYEMFQTTLKNVKKNFLSEHPKVVTVHVF